MSPPTELMTKSKTKHPIEVLANQIRNNLNTSND